MTKNKVHKQRCKKTRKLSSNQFPPGTTQEDIENYQEDMKSLFWDEYDMWVNSLEEQHRKDKQHEVAS